MRAYGPGSSAALRIVLALALVFQAAIAGAHSVRMDLATQAGASEQFVVICTADGVKSVAFSELGSNGGPSPGPCHCQCAVACAACHVLALAAAATSIRYDAVPETLQRVEGGDAFQPLPIAWHRGTPRSPPHHSA